MRPPTLSDRPTTIPEALRASVARDRGSFVFHLGDDQVERFSCAQLVERAERGARRLVALGVEPGDAVGVLGPNRPEWVVWSFAAWLAGATLVPIQIPLRVRDADAFAEQLRRLVEAGGCRRVMADPRLAGLLPSGVAVPWLEQGDQSSEPLAAPGPESAAVIQFTSGSTATPKGALISHAAALAQMDVLREGYHRGPDNDEARTILSWTPFFHDLGLFSSVVQTATSGLTSHQLPTDLFARDPVEWLRLIGRTRVSATVAPSSAFGSAIRAARKRGEQIDLSSLEGAYFAAEGVDPDVVKRIVELAQEFDFDPRALGSTYGLAEAVMAVAYPVVGTGMHLDRVSLRELAEDGLAAPVDGGPSRLLVSCGAPRMETRIVGGDGEPLPERHVGQIRLRGPSLMDRYVGRDAPDPFVDGWLCTGDMGYLADGELYPTGRAKDMVVAMGHNYYPEDFEWAAARVDGIRPGRCVAFAKPHTEQVVVLVEQSDGQATGALRRDVRRAIADAVGLAPDEIVVLPPGTIEKTTSGKLRRAAMRDAYLAGTLPAL
jgi:acyl-CoA synthetase (AMP-forming)/AMP-acid ligase II